MTAAAPPWRRWPAWPSAHAYTLFRFALAQTSVAAIILSALTAAVALFAAGRFLLWVLLDARWSVIPANFDILAFGPYPAKLIWRGWLTLTLFCGLVAFVVGTLSRTAVAVPGLLAAGLGTAAAFAVLPSRSAAGIALIAALSLLCRHAGGVASVQVVRKVMGPALLLVLPLSWLVLSGVGPPGSPWASVSSDQWGGLTLTLFLSFGGIILSFPCAVFLAMGRRSSLPVPRALATGYVEFIRGVPLISLLVVAQVMLQLFIPPSLPVPGRLTRALVAIVGFSAAYMAENIRGGLKGLARGQTEAAASLGLRPLQIFVTVLLPQALINTLPVTISLFIGLVIDTSLVALVGLLDFTGVAKSVLSNPAWLGYSTEMYVFALAVYWLLCYGLSRTGARAEQQLKSQQR